MDFSAKAKEILAGIIGRFRRKPQPVSLRFNRGKDGSEWLGRVSPGYRPCSLCYGMSCAEPNCPECEGEGEVKVFREPTREEARALTDAGYMPVSEYGRRFGDAEKTGKPRQVSRRLSRLERVADHSRAHPAPRGRRLRRLPGLSRLPGEDRRAAPGNGF